MDLETAKKELFEIIDLLHEETDIFTACIRILGYEKLYNNGVGWSPDSTFSDKSALLPLKRGFEDEEDRVEIFCDWECETKLANDVMPYELYKYKKGFKNRVAYSDHFEEAKEKLDADTRFRYTYDVDNEGEYHILYEIHRGRLEYQVGRRKRDLLRYLFFDQISCLSLGSIMVRPGTPPCAIHMFTFLKFLCEIVKATDKDGNIVGETKKEKASERDRILFNAYEMFKKGIKKDNKDYKIIKTHWEEAREYLGITKFTPVHKNIPQFMENWDKYMRENLLSIYSRLYEINKHPEAAEIYSSVCNSYIPSSSSLYPSIIQAFPELRQVRVNFIHFLTTVKDKGVPEYPPFLPSYIRERHKKGYPVRLVNHSTLNNNNDNSYVEHRKYIRISC